MFTTLSFQTWIHSNVPTGPRQINRTESNRNRDCCNVTANSGRRSIS